MPMLSKSIHPWDGFYADILKQPVWWDGDHVIPPTALGLGVELNKVVADANPYAGDELHLDMREGPPY